MASEVKNPFETYVNPETGIVNRAKKKTGHYGKKHPSEHPVGSVVWTYHYDREKWLSWVKPALWGTKKYKKQPGEPPRGWRRKDWDEARDKIRPEVQEVTRKIMEKYNLDDAYAKEALETAVEVMRMPNGTKDRLTAAKIILDFTKQKPAQKSEVTLNKAEAFLEAILNDDGDTQA